MSDWIPTCKEIGGPVNVNLDYCLHQDTGCDAFKKGHCNFDEQHVLANVPGSFPPASCQVSRYVLNRFDLKIMLSDSIVPGILSKLSWM